MSLISLKKATSLSLLSFSIFGLASCGTTNVTPVDPVEEEIDALEALEKAYLAKNYTLDIQDDSGNFVQYFMSDFYAYKFEDKSIYTCYKEDNTGIYTITATDEAVTNVGFYEMDSSTGEYTKGLYENVTYSLSDLSLLPKYYREINGGYYLRDTEGDEAKVWFYLCGFNDDGSVGGVTLSLIDEMGFYVNEEKDIVFDMVFDSSLQREDTIITIKNVGKTTEPSAVKKYLDEGGIGKSYLSSSDMLYTYLGYLRNMYNYTLKVKSYYSGDNESRNYEVTTKFTNKAYFSVSSRSNEGDLGYVLDDGVIKELLIDGASGNAVIGDAVKDDDGNTYTSLTSVVNSLKDLSWNDLVFEAYKNAEKDYTIENKNFIADVATLLDDVFFRFEIPSLRFEIFGEGKDQTYRFTANLYSGDYITLDIVDINSTVIGNL